MKIVSDEYRFAVRPLSTDEGGGFLVEYPDIPGCMADSETIEEAMAKGREALCDCIESCCPPEPVGLRTRGLQTDLMQRNALGYSKLGYSKLGYSKLGYSKLGYSKLGYSKLGYSKRIFGCQCVIAMAAFAALATPVLAQQANIPERAFWKTSSLIGSRIIRPRSRN